MNDGRKIDFNSLDWDSPAPGIRSRNFTGSGKQLRLVEISRDFVEEDWCLKGHAGFVVEGELEIEFDGETIAYKAGDGLVIPEGEASKHKPKAISETAKLFLVEDC